MEDKIALAVDNTVEKIKKDTQKDYMGIKANVKDAVTYLQIAMFPDFFKGNTDFCQSCSSTDECSKGSDGNRRREAFMSASLSLIAAARTVIQFKDACDITENLIKKIPSILEDIETDIEAAYQGDPAAKSKDEVILSYPAFYAISTFRIAHELFVMNLPVIPRIMTELAHEKTGIDIHPGATIGQYFFIDHGTGVVIGETTTIGSHVKLYQHVTLGAKSIKVGPDGQLIKEIKRHPDIGNNVVIYAGATILGGDTVIGDNSVIGGNVWLTHSIEPNSTVISNPAGLKVLKKQLA